jgi:hypothetical protein
LNESIYAPPEADIAVKENNDGGYYVVSPGKFLTLTILTLGLYLIYWFYRQWRMVKERDGSSIWPIPRGLFYVFFTHTLYRDINAKLRQDQVEHPWSPGITATLVVIFTILSNVLGRLSGENIGSPLTDILSLMLVPLLAYTALPAQKAANIASGDADGVGNNRFTGANWAWMLVGGLIWILSLFGLYLVITQPELFVEP